MGKEYRAKVFKSGNSLALRLPKELGIGEGDDIAIAPHADGSFSFWKESEALNVLMSLYGAFSPDFMAKGRGDIVQADYDWGTSSARGKAA